MLSTLFRGLEVDSNDHFTIAIPSISLFHSAMPSEIDPSTLSAGEVSRMTKKDVAKHLAALQHMFAERGKKYGAYLRSSLPVSRLLTISQSEKAKSIIRKGKTLTQAKNTNAKLVPKPAGRRSRNFNIFEAMNSRPDIVQVSKATYKNLIVSRRKFRFSGAH